MALTPLVNLPSPSDPANFASEADNFISVQLPNLVSEWNNDISLFNNQDTRSTSTTSLVVGTGTKSLTVGTGKMYQPNMTIRIGAVSVANTYMEGVITSYNSTTGALVVNVIYFLGTGTIASWNTFLVPSIFAGGNLSFSGTGNRIIADFSNTTQSDRLLFQTSTANSNTCLGATPSGTGKIAAFRAYSTSSPTTNYSFINIECNGDVSEARIESSKAGTGTYLPLRIYTSDQKRISVSTTGEVAFHRRNASEATAILLNKSDDTNGWLNFLTAGATPAYVIQNTSGVGVQLAWGTTSWTTVSDENKKDIIEPIANGLDKVNSLRAVIGKYKSDEEGVRRSFLIAQDVQSVLPESISIEDDGTLGLRYTEIIPLLVAAIKELSAKVEALENV